MNDFERSIIADALISVDSFSSFILRENISETELDSIQKVFEEVEKFIEKECPYDLIKVHLYTRITNIRPSIYVPELLISFHNGGRWEKVISYIWLTGGVIK